MKIFDRRPWGWMIKFIHLPFIWIKFIHVYKGQRTSKQFHYDRYELHIGSTGFTYVPKERIHRIGEGNYLEIAWGSVTESDIVRLEDDYDRL